MVVYHLLATTVLHFRADERTLKIKKKCHATKISPVSTVIYLSTKHRYTYTDRDLQNMHSTFCELESPASVYHAPTSYDRRLFDPSSGLSMHYQVNNTLAIGDHAYLCVSDEIWEFITSQYLHKVTSMVNKWSRFISSVKAPLTCNLHELIMHNGKATKETLKDVV